MQYTREQLEQMPDHQLGDLINAMTGNTLLPHTWLSGDGMLRLMEWLLRKNDWSVAIETWGLSRKWLAVVTSQSNVYRATDTSAPRALAIAALLAGEDCK